MGKKKTHEEFVKSVESKFGNKYSILTNYINSSTKIKVKHNVCLYEWDVYPNNLLNGKSKCPKCSKRMTYNTETFGIVVNEITNGEYKLTGEYINNYSKTSIKHLLCEYEWEVTPNCFYSLGVRCPRCQRKERYTDEDFKKKVEELTYGEIIPLDRYKNNYTNIRFQHINCGAIFEEIPARIINELKSCPECRTSLSKGEKRISVYLEEKGIKFQKQFTFEDCKDIGLLKFDFAIMKEKELIMIEYDGEQHFRPIEWFGGEDAFIGIQRRDGIKNEYCKSNDIPILRIPYWEFNNIEYLLDNFIKDLNFITN